MDVSGGSFGGPSLGKPTEPMEDATTPEHQPLCIGMTLIPTCEASRVSAKEEIGGRSGEVPPEIKNLDCEY